MLRIICEIISPLNGSPMKKISSRATPSDSNTPTCEWLSLMWYDSPNMPEKIEPAAIPLVMVEEIPAMSNAKANTMAALLPKSGSSKDFACCNSSTCMPLLKKVAAASRIIALLMAHPTIMEKSVSNSSYFNTLRMELSSFLLYS